MKPDESLLQKFLDNKCTPEEASEVISCVSDPEGKRIFENQFEKDVAFLENGYQFNEDQLIPSIEIYQRIHDKIQALPKKGIKNSIKQFSQSWVKIAASILIPLLLANAITWYFVSRPDNKVVWQEVYVPKGEKLQVMFQDGTKVWINSDTRLKYPVEFKGYSREVKLDGEAYFAVAKNPKKPFLVNSKGLSIKVTGTSFNVKAYSNERHIITTLDEGKISLLYQHNQKNIETLLNPKQTAVFDKELMAVKLGDASFGQNSGWKENKLEFKNTPIEEVTKALERWYNIKCEIEDPEIKSFNYTITFKNETLKNVLFGLEKITPIRCDLKKGLVIISKK